MPSQNIVQNIRVRIQKQLLPAAPARWRKQISFGLQAYGLRSFQSLTGNARMASVNPRTGVRRSERLLANAKLAAQLGTVFDALGFVKQGSFVNIDHSDMNGLTALVGAVQTRRGRAIPCMVDATYAHHIPADGSSKSTPRWQKLRAAMVLARRTQSFTGHTIDALQNFADRLGFWPKLVFDRGFGNESLVTHLQAEGATFYVRLKSGRFVEYDGQRTEIKLLKANDATISLFGLTLRVIRSPRGRRSPEPWYILTNDTGSSRSKVVKIYYHRFEIEETFRDVKHIFELKRTRLQKPLSLILLLWFVCLGIALLRKATRPAQHLTDNVHPKKQVSWLRQSYEQLQQAYGLLAWG